MQSASYLSRDRVDTAKNWSSNYGQPSCVNALLLLLLLLLTYKNPCAAHLAVFKSTCRYTIPIMRLHTV